MIEMDIREADDEMLIEELANRGIQTIRTFSDTELNNEISRRRQIVEKQFEAVMGQELI